ncbi:hypothetical protein LTR49_008922 [Elasticomyces elasticus]|nr:hypothetical protein LTR49_008922 [Elasticomyces elasticus]
MNGAGTSKRRSARLSHEGIEENEPPAKKSKANGAPATTVSTKEQDGDAKVVAKRKPRKTYDEDVDGFAFNKGTRKAKEPKQPAVRNSVIEDAPPVVAAPVPAKTASPVKPQVPPPAPTEEAAPKPVPKKTRRRFPTTPEREAAERPKRRSKRLSSENESSDPVPSPFKPAHAKSHANTERSPSPDKARPITVSKKRKVGENGGEEEQKVMRIALPFQDTPVIRRNKEMRKGDSNDHRRSSSGMRGQRASSLMDEGRGNGTYAPVILSATSNLTPLLAEVLGEHDRSNSNAQEEMLSGVQQVTPETSDSTSPVDTETIQSNQEHLADRARLDDTALPHTEVPTAEFFKHISADITEPRRMRCLLGWCGTRALPPKPEAPKDSSSVVEGREFQALQAARVIQAELSQDLVAKGMLSDWFSRDEGELPLVPLRRAANPRNVANAAKAEELEGELARLKAELASWEALKDNAIPVSPPSKPGASTEIEGALSPLQDELLDSPQRAILEELRGPGPTDPEVVQGRLRTVVEGLEFSIDSFAQGVHALKASRDTAERLVEKSLGDAASVLEGREKARKVEGKGVDPLEALRGLGRVLNVLRLKVQMADICWADNVACQSSEVGNHAIPIPTSPHVNHRPHVSSTLTTLAYPHTLAGHTVQY